MSQPKVQPAPHGPEALRIRSDPAELAFVRRYVQETARAVGFAEADVAKIILAVDEALANVIRHGYEGTPDEPIDVCIERAWADADPALRVAIRDYGKQVDPECIVGRPLEEVRPGGLGVHIIRSVMDEVCYAPQPGGGMQLTMLKKKSS